MDIKEIIASMTEGEKAKLQLDQVRSIVRSVKQVLAKPNTLNSSEDFFRGENYGMKYVVRLLEGVIKE